MTHNVHGEGDAMHEGQFDVKPGPPERIWIDSDGKDQSFWNDSGEAHGTTEYVRADLVSRAPVAAPQGDDVWCGNPACHFCRHRNLVPAAFAASSPSSPVPPEQCLVTCADFPMHACDAAHRCVRDAGHPFDPQYAGEIHEFESHQTTVKPRVAATPTPVEQERETLIYWLLRAYQSGHRDGWEKGPSTDETMDSICDVLANRGYDPSEDEAARVLLKQPARF